MTEPMPNWVTVILNFLAAVVMIGALFGLDILPVAGAFETLILLLPPVVVAIVEVYEAVKRLLISRRATNKFFASSQEIHARLS